MRLPCDDDNCTFHVTNLARGSANARRGDAPVQTQSSRKRDDPYDMAEQLGTAPSTCITTSKTSVTVLGREELMNQLPMLADSAATLKSGDADNLEDVTSRVSSAERQTSTLEATRRTDETKIWAGIEALKVRYEALCNRVERLMQAKSGQRASPSLLQSQTGTAGMPARKQRHSSSALHKVHLAEDLAPATAAPPAEAVSAPTDPLLGRCQALESRASALVATSGDERDALANELEETLGDVASGAALLQKMATNPAALSLGTRMDASSSALDSWRTYLRRPCPPQHLCRLLRWQPKAARLCKLSSRHLL